MKDAMKTTSYVASSQSDPLQAVTGSEDNFAIKPPAKASQSPSTSWKLRWMHSIVHHELLLNNCVLFSVNVKSGGDDCGIVKLSALW